MRTAVDSIDDMDEVSPAHLRDGVEFQLKLRGYDPAQVDDFLDRVAGGIELMQQQLRDALERAGRAEQQVAESAETDQALRKTLVLAQRTAEQATQEAEQRAAAIVAEAQTAAKRAKADGQRALRNEIKQLEKARAALEADVEALDRYLVEERARLKQVIAHKLGELDTSLGERPGPPSLRTVPVPPPVEVDDEDAAEGDEGDEGDEVDGTAAAGVPDGAALEEPETDEEPALADVFADADAGDDPFMDELRRAVVEDEPLGPRDHAPVTGEQPQFDLPDRSRWGLRRRR